MSGKIAPWGAPSLYGTTYNNVGVSSPYDAVAYMRQIKSQDMTINQQRWLRGSRSLSYALGDSNLYGYSRQGPPNLMQNAQFGSFNVIEPKINIVTGMQRQHRKSLIAQSTFPGGNKVATQFSKCFVYNDIKKELSYKFSRGFEHGVRTGLAIGEVFLDRTSDLINGDIDLRIWEYNSFVFDYTCRDIWNFSDCKYVWFQYYADKYEVMKQYPKHAKKIKSFGPGGYGNDTFYFLPEAVSPRQIDTVIVSRFWMQVPVKKEAWIDDNTGETFWVKPEQLGQFTKKEIDSTAWRLSIVVNHTLVEEEISPNNIEEAPFVAFTWDYNPEIQQPQLRVRGLPDSLIDAQFLINRRMILNHNICESSKNSGIMFEEGSVDDIEAAKKGGEGHAVVYAKGSAPPQPILPVALPESNFRLVDQLLQFIEISSNVKDALTGSGTDSKSGIMEMVRQDAATMGLTKYFDDCDNSLKRLGRLQMCLMVYNWSPHKIANILNTQPQDVFDMFNVNLRDFSLVVSEGMYTDIQKRTEFVTAAEVCGMLGIKPPSKFMLEKAPIQGADELISALEAQERSQAEVDAQKVSIELAVKQTEIELLKAKTLEQQNLALAHYSRAGSYQGLEHERNAEVIKNLSVAHKNNSEAIQKLSELIDQYGIDAVKRLLEKNQQSTESKISLEGPLNA